MLQAIRFRLVWAFDVHGGNLGALAHIHDEADTHEFMGVVQVRFRVDLRLKEPSVLKEFPQSVFRTGMRAGIVRVFV